MKVLDSGAGGVIGIPSKWWKGGVADAVGVTSYDGQYNNGVPCSWGPNKVDLPNVEFYFGEAKVVVDYYKYSWPSSDVRITFRLVL